MPVTDLTGILQTLRAENQITIDGCGGSVSLWCTIHCHVQWGCRRLDQEDRHVVLTRFGSLTEREFSVYLCSPHPLESDVRYLLSMWPYWREQFLMRRKHCLEVVLE